MDTHLGICKVKGLELFGIIVAEIAKHGCISYAGVTLTEYESVAILPLRIFLFNVKVSVIHNGKNVHNAHSAANMTASRPNRGLKTEMP